MERLWVAVISLVLTLGSYAARAAGDAKAAELLAQAKKAIGGEQKASSVTALSAAGTVNRAMGDRQISGELTLDLQLPDKMVRTESISPMGDGALVVTSQGVNGDTLLRNTRMVNAPPGLVVRTPPPPAAGSDAETQALRNSRAELARLSIALLLSAPSSLPVEFTYAGEAEAPDGKADVLDVKGPSSFSAKLFLDKTTHRPLMLAYRGVAPRIVMQTQRGGPPPGAQGDVAAMPPAETVDINMFFDDYRSVDGLLLPHHMSRSVGGEVTEEWTFKTVRLNPTFKADTFAAK
jgi:hypothetical protein